MPLVRIVSLLPGRICRLLTTTAAVHVRVRGMSSQITNRVMMVRPGLFRSNPCTMADNAFQSEQKSASVEEIHSAALREFDAYAERIRQQGILVDVVEDTLKVPDAVFPNNWVSFHSLDPGGANKPVIALYPMMSLPRRKERRLDVVQRLVQQLGAEIKDYSKYENDGLYLEGTGSMVIDRTNNIVYASLSPRTSETLLKQFCNDFNCKLVSFRALAANADGVPLPIYHTNVMMSVGTTFAVVCTDSITDITEREVVCESLSQSGKVVIPISKAQMSKFAGNMLQLQSTRGHSVIAMSTQAYESLTDKQLALFDEHCCSVVHSDLSTVEKYSGGSARCMLAEVFPPLKT